MESSVEHKVSLVEHEVSLVNLVRRLHDLFKATKQMNILKSLEGSLGSLVEHENSSDKLVEQIGSLDNLVVHLYN